MHQIKSSIINQQSAISNQQFSAMQLTHYTSKFSPRLFPITVICENVTNAANVGSLFRTVDAFGVSKLIFCGGNIPLGRKMTKTSRATEKHVNFEVKSEVIPILKQLKSENYKIIALEITNKSIPIYALKIELEGPIALLIGDENFGISEECLQLADEIVHIKMFGHNSSMNVVQATSIALYEITKKIEQLKSLNL